MKKQYHFAVKRKPFVVKRESGVTESVEIIDVQSAPARPLVILIRRVNIVSPICRVMLGEDHNVIQRMVVGVGVMSFGVLVAQTVGHSSNAVLSHIGDAVGYGLHGLGLTPFVEYLASKYGRRDEA